VGTRIVKTQEGAKFYGLPIGATITTDKYNSVNAKNAARGIKPPPNAVADTDRPVGAPIGKVSKPAAKKPLKLKVKKTELKGNKHFSVGKSKYTAPNGSRVVRPRNQPELAYIVTPQGEIHVFNAAGEVEIPKEMLDQFKERFGAEFAPEDEKYEEAEFDATSSSYDIESLNPGSILTDTEGTPQFEKLEDGTWEHVDLEVAIDEKELKELYDAGDLLPAEGAADEVSKAAFDMSEATNFNTMEKEEFETALDGFPENTVLNHGDKKFTKSADGSWKAKDDVAVPSKTLYLIKNKLSVTGALDPSKPDEAVVDNPNPLDAEANPTTRLRVGQAATPDWAKNAPEGAEVTYTSESGKETVWVKDKGKWTVGNEKGGYSAVSLDEETFTKSLQAAEANAKVSKLIADPEEVAEPKKPTTKAAAKPAAPAEPEAELPDGVPAGSAEITSEDAASLAVGAVVFQQFGEEEPVGFKKVSDTEWIDLDPDMGYTWYSDNFESDSQKTFRAPATTEVEEGGFPLYEGGPEFAKEDISAVIDALESHSGFQISYGLKNIPDSPLAETGVLNELKAAASEKYPELRPKQALIRYLKAAAGEDNVKPEDDPDAPRVKIGSDNPAMGAQGFNGGEFLADDIIEAIRILENYSGKLFKAELNNNDNPLGLLDPNKLVDFDKDKTITKQKFIEMLKDKLASLESSSVV
jgi:hypothetical protein